MDPIVSRSARTASVRISDLLRTDIIRGRIRTGARLKVDELAERYGTSPMPVREALRVLEGERLIALSPHKGATVRPVTVSFVRDVYDVRGALEGLLAGECALRASASERATLEGLASAWEETARSGASAEAVLGANHSLHTFIADIAGNEEAKSIIYRGWPLLEALRRQIGYANSRIEEISAQHGEIVARILDGNAEGAHRAARQHCVSAREDLIARLSELAHVEIRPERPSGP
jgi:DNA-binding GntR family transcriptional regulator